MKPLFLDLLTQSTVLLLLQVLADFPHTTAELKVDYLLDLFPEIQPRSFSIASSLQVAHHASQVFYSCDIQ